MDGVLKSWAVPKEPPTGAGVKRLAVAVDDHDIDYADFEGTIPEGQYGAGTVKIWDKGNYSMISVHKEKMVFDLKGKKLKGEYVLLRFAKAGPKNWLLFKKEEEKKE
jgi:DNA ligase D-like protein (predicted 3'-phosphoesterase)